MYEKIRSMKNRNGKDILMSFDLRIRLVIFIKDRDLGLGVTAFKHFKDQSC